MAEPLVSICVPTIGRLEYLPEVRASLAAQTFRDYEVLVLDNASPPEAREQLERWAKKEPRVRLLRVEERVPMFRNFKRGIEQTRGRYVTFCHDDDAMGGDFLRRNVDFMQAHPDVVFAGCNYDLIDEKSRLVENRAWIRRTEVWSDRRYIRTLVRRGRNPITMQSVFYRREELAAGWDDTITPHFGDFVILMRMAEGRSVGLIAETLTRVRHHDGQASKWTLSRGIPLRTEVLLAYCRELSLRWPASDVAALERDVRRAHALYLAWGWLSAPDRQEAEACLAGLDRSGVEAGLAKVMRAFDKLGSLPDARRRVASVVRRVANR